MSLLDQMRKEDEDDSLSDEAILNVLRRNDDKVLKTAEIADELPITPNWTSKRLNQLENQGRVHSKSAGQGRVWWLDDSEAPSPVAEGIGDIMWYSTLANRTGRMVMLTGIGTFAVSGLLLVPILLFGFFPALNELPVTVNDFATVAMLAAFAAGLFLVVGSSFKLASLAIRRYYSFE